jgi:hypothetical protein
MSFPPSKSKTYVNGEVLTHTDLNTSLSDAVNSNIPEDIDDYSVNATEMQTTTDPYPAAAVSLPTTIAGELERIRYIIKQITGKSQWYVDAAAIGTKGADVASASALPVLTDGNFFDVTGTTAITSINTLGVGSVIRLQFDDALVLTHHSTDLILPGATNITTVAGDVATFVEYAAGDWILVAYSGISLRPGTQTIPGTKTFSGQLIGKGTATNDNAASGYIGESARAINTTFTNAAATTQFKDVTSISLTAGDWLVTGNVSFTLNGATMTQAAAAISINSNNTTTDHVQGDNLVFGAPPTANYDQDLNIGDYRLSLTGTTTVYLKGRCDFSAGTPQHKGRISAVRIR